MDLINWARREAAMWRTSWKTYNDSATNLEALADALERAEAKLAAVDKQREDFFWDKQRAETERDALLYNAESKYCAGMSAGFELGRNDDRAELSRIITQRWSEIADAKARSASQQPCRAGGVNG